MDYSIHTDIKYKPLELIDVGRIARDCEERWWNQTLCRVNDSVLRLGVLHGEFHWHRHENEDELFLVTDGKLLVDLREKTFELGPGQAVVIPKGVEHRTRAPVRTVVLMLATASVVPTGD
jgi:mannose-6-phosphate isomerase-like protein (cupin superfamily)